MPIVCALLCLAPKNLHYDHLLRTLKWVIQSSSAKEKPVFAFELPLHSNNQSKKCLSLKGRWVGRKISKCNSYSHKMYQTILHTMIFKLGLFFFLKRRNWAVITALAIGRRQRNSHSNNLSYFISSKGKVS